MRIVFTKCSGKSDRMEVIRASGVTETLACPKQGIIPHEMVHCAVEGTLHRRGFVAHVLDGKTPGFNMAMDAESDGVERLVEVFQADAWAGWTTLPTDMLDLYRVTCFSRECAPLDVSVGDIEEIRRKMLDLSAKWQAIAIGETLVIDG